MLFGGFRRDIRALCGVCAQMCRGDPPSVNVYGATRVVATVSHINVQDKCTGTLQRSNRNIKKEWCNVARIWWWSADGTWQRCTYTTPMAVELKHVL